MSALHSSDAEKWRVSLSKFNFGRIPDVFSYHSIVAIWLIWELIVSEFEQPEHWKVCDDVIELTSRSLKDTSSQILYYLDWGEVKSKRISRLLDIGCSLWKSSASKEICNIRMNVDPTIVLSNNKEFRPTIRQSTIGVKPFFQHSDMN